MGKLGRLGRRKRTVPTDGDGLKTWVNDKGEVCVGSNCFHVKASGDDVVVHYNSEDPTCDVNVKQAVDKMFDLIGKGGMARFQRRKQ